MLTSLLTRARVLARAHSVRIAVIGALVSLFAAIDPVSLQSAWQSLPPNVVALIPDRFQQWIGSALFFLVILARGMPQPAVAERLGLLGGAVPTWLRAVRTPINRAITGIVVHCSATREGQSVDAAEIRRWHLAKKWSDIGYHFVIRLDGTIEVGRPLRTAGAHVEGHNRTTVGICYVGGVASDGKTPKDTRTPAQKAALLDLLRALKAQYPTAKICGHRDLSPDRNGKVQGRIFGVDANGPARFNHAKLRADLRLLSGRLAPVKIECLDYAELIRRYDAADALFYLDPPYDDTTGYGIPFGRDQYRAMAEQLGGIAGQFVMSINNTPFIRETFAGFDIEEVGTTWTLSGHHSHGSKKVTELIIRNRPR